DAVLEQAREQAAEDHGVGDVGDVELVEAQKPGFLGERDGHRSDRIVAYNLAALELLAPSVHVLVHVEHELVKMSAALAHDRARAKEQVHEHGLAAADVAENVEPLRRTVAVVAPEQPSKRRRLARQPLLLEARVET